MYSRPADFHLQAVCGPSYRPPGSPVCWSRCVAEGVPGTADAAPALVEHELRRLLAQPREQTAAREDPLTIRTRLCPVGAVSVKDT